MDKLKPPEENATNYYFLKEDSTNQPQKKRKVEQPIQLEYKKVRKLSFIINE